MLFFWKILRDLPVKNLVETEIICLITRLHEEEGWDKGHPECVRLYLWRHNNQIYFGKKFCWRVSCNLILFNSCTFKLQITRWLLLRQYFSLQLFHMSMLDRNEKFYNMLIYTKLFCEISTVQDKLTKTSASVWVCFAIDKRLLKFSFNSLRVSGTFRKRFSDLKTHKWNSFLQWNFSLSCQWWNIRIPNYD